MGSINFDDIHQRRDAARALIIEKRRRLRPLIPLARAALSTSRLLGFEQQLFQNRFQPVVQRFADRVEHSFDDYTPTASDALVCSCFKSGTHWMMQIAHQIAHRGRGEYDNIYDVIPWNEGPNPKLCMPLTDPRPLQLSPIDLRIIKTHAASWHVPYNEAAEYICVIRDPIDVFVSSYHFIASAMFGELRPASKPGSTCICQTRPSGDPGQNLPPATGPGATGLTCASSPTSRYSRTNRPPSMIWPVSWVAI
ncbi:MAG: hypothetical protein DRQ54_04195 [Gammaproteobacteria bacterium]|nr:MAG: hypothetical protein DRQ54_04195 [Gammaproteobacteria bacterium]